MFVFEVPEPVVTLYFPHMAQVVMGGIDGDRGMDQDHDTLITTPKYGGRMDDEGWVY